MAVSSVALTPAAVTEVRRFMQEHGAVESAGLRIAASPGGCGGLEYGLRIEDEPQAADEVLLIQGLRVFLDPASNQVLSGVEVDYIETEHGAGFTFSNPNSGFGCGCACDNYRHP